MSSPIDVEALREARWFAGKHRRIAGVRAVADWGVLGVAEVTYDDGAESDMYLLLGDGLRWAQLLAHAPLHGPAGRIELRGVGIVEMANLRDVPVALYVDLELSPDRLPQEGERRPVAGIALPVIGLAPFEASAALKVEAALRLIGLTD